MRTGIPVRYFLLGILLTSVNICRSQHWEKPASKFYIWEIDKQSGEHIDIYSLLVNNVPSEQTCNTTWGMFYFRVVATGKVDSLVYEGSLKNETVNQIKRNIYATQGHWKVPNGTKLTEKYWFIYPYFDFGPYSYESSECSESQKLLQKNIMNLADSFNTLKTFGNNKSFLLQPGKVGSEYPKE